MSSGHFLPVFTNKTNPVCTATMSVCHSVSPPSMFYFTFVAVTRETHALIQFKLIHMQLCIAKLCEDNIITFLRAEVSCKMTPQCSSKYQFVIRLFLPFCEIGKEGNPREASMFFLAACSDSQRLFPFNLVTMTL